MGGRACAWLEFKLKWEWKALVRRFLWLSDAARPQPNELIVLLCCFATFLHEGEHICFLVCGELVFCDVACNVQAVVVAVTLDEPPCAHLILPSQVGRS
jgi:hypothetical protein